ncbi:MAG TPA: hypothetical protein VMW73_12270 [Spirochaetia bacterium]|nr:hypothetical protein [Spirochaetia bacterium]
MATYYLNIGLTYIVIGLAVAILFYYAFRKHFLGNFWGALIVALVGSFLGGIIDYFFGDIIKMLANLNNSVNIFPPIITSFIIVWIFSKLSDFRD